LTGPQQAATPAAVMLEAVTLLQRPMGFTFSDACMQQISLFERRHAVLA
jgi:hypothetical protein